MEERDGGRGGLDESERDREQVRETEREGEKGVMK